jgi:hypothetical protein
MLLFNVINKLIKSFFIFYNQFVVLLLNLIQVFYLPIIIIIIIIIIIQILKCHQVNNRDIKKKYPIIR